MASNKEARKISKNINNWHDWFVTPYKERNINDLDIDMLARTYSEIIDALNESCICVFDLGCNNASEQCEYKSINRACDEKDDGFGNICMECYHKYFMQICEVL